MIKIVFVYKLQVHDNYLISFSRSEWREVIQNVQWQISFLLKVKVYGNNIEIIGYRRYPSVAL